jgi:hypothetical protein
MDPLFFPSISGIDNPFQLGTILRGWLVNFHIFGHAAEKKEANGLFGFTTEQGIVYRLRSTPYGAWSDLKMKKKKYEEKDWKSHSSSLPFRVSTIPFSSEQFYVNKGLYIGYGVLRTEHGVTLREPGLCIDYPFMGR